ncbi:MAG: His/Gly/Thr/Pro-type tRNA ligase C-terminal domain-containing protein [Chlamydiales bacterium]|nr:His/Gly/Thr/Pro-type tRNA ligase C-terminal domain-containing protein [Chlamydiales bacterium]
MTPLDIKRRSTAELMAIAVLSLFPDAQLAGGKSHAFGFFYDFMFSGTPDAHFLQLLEERMRFIASEDRLVHSKTMMRENAAMYFRHNKQNILAERALSLDTNLVSLFCVDDFCDLCKEPYVRSTKDTLSFKIQGMKQIGTSDFKKIIRIDAIAFETKSEIKKFLKKFEDAKARDPIQLSKELQFISVLDELDGKIMLQKKGVIFLRILQDFFRHEYENHGFSEEITPRLGDARLLQRLGIRKENIDDFFLNSSLSACMHACNFQSEEHLELSLPLRYFEFYDKYNLNIETREPCFYEKESVISDIATIFCSRAQVQEEITCLLHFILKIIKIFSIDHVLCLSSDKAPRGHSRFFWQEARGILQEVYANVSKKVNSPLCEVVEEARDEAEFRTGPRLQFFFKNALGRKVEGPYIELNTFFPEKMGLTYIDEKNKKNVPFLVAANVCGSLESLMALLIEQYAGILPFWMAPEQVRIVCRSCGASSICYAEKVRREFLQAGIRAFVDCSKNKSENKLEHKIHVAQLEKVPYIVLIDDREIEDEIVREKQFMIRGLNQKEPVKMELSCFIKKLTKLGSSNLDVINQVQ